MFDIEEPYFNEKPSCPWCDSEFSTHIDNEHITLIECSNCDYYFYDDDLDSAGD